jgi:anti-sigma regulatory factor (Ser/Thr protein kinase)
MRWCRAFPGKPAHARHAREFVRFLLAGTPVAMDVVQVAAELIANAGQHTRSGAPGGLLIVEVWQWKGGAALTVTDQGDPPGTPPAQIKVNGNDPTREHGHGLRIVDELSTSWNVRGGPAGRSFITTFTW